MAVKRKKKKDIKELELQEDIVDKKLDDIEEISKQEIISKEDESIKEEVENNDLDETKIEKKKFKKWKLVLILIVIILFLVLLGVIFFPRIELNGKDAMEISYNEEYIEPGYNLYVLNKKIPNNIKVDSNIKEGVVGDYQISYVYNLFGIKIKKSRKVGIVDTISPVLSVKEDSIKVCPNKDIPEIEYEAVDEYDGDITSLVERIEKDDEVIFSIYDSSNNKSMISVMVDKTDDEKPSIKLKGNSSMFITYGNSYKEPGYTATDNCSGDITSKVKVSGSVGRDIGKYQIKYEVEDDSGNKTTVIRSVVVGAKVSDNGSVKKGTIYLTFDDGPNQGTTNKILDILKSEEVKATFFVTCKGPDNLIKRMHEEGHTVALHTASHEYSYVYSSVDNYFTDLYKVRDRVKRITGVDSKIIRFPGGSSNTISRSYSKGIMTVLTNTVLSEGYRYFDWNVDGRDAGGARSSSDVYYNVTSGLSHNRANVVLLHDIKSITVGALEDIIKFGKEYGYEFSAIDMNTYMVRHSVNN
ncbi:MAG: polysaccharide deacetylase family protein [Bacilli bacterium]|nr:polysaccharide deacetylase family protein [Bacilli bacterium]